MLFVFSQANDDLSELTYTQIDFCNSAPGGNADNTVYDMLQDDTVKDASQSLYSMVTLPQQ